MIAVTDTGMESGTDSPEFMPGAIDGNWRHPYWDAIQDARLQEYNRLGAIPLLECEVSISADLVTVTHQGTELYREGSIPHLGPHYPFYPAKALMMLAPDFSPAWKTFGLFRTLRQAVREATVQGMEIRFPEAGASRQDITGFLRIARVYDAEHHGEATF